MVFGTGGVGSNCIEALARGGIGKLIVVDGDEVMPSNINRQAIAFTDTVGMRKVDAVRTFIARINPATEVITFDQFVMANDVEALMTRAANAAAQQIDYLVDAIDTVSVKLALATWAQTHRLPLISSMGGANKLNPAKLCICDIFETSHDPLARVMRRECRKRAIDNLTVLSSTEEPQRPTSATQENNERPTLGTVSYLPPIMGQMIAGFVICQLLGEPHA